TLTGGARGTRLTFRPAGKSSWFSSTQGRGSISGQLWHGRFIILHLSLLSEYRHVIESLALAPERNSVPRKGHKVPCGFIIAKREWAGKYYPNCHIGLKNREKEWSHSVSAIRQRPTARRSALPSSANQPPTSAIT